MTHLLLFLLALLTGLTQPKAPTTRIAFHPLTKAEYLAAKKKVIVTSPKLTFPVRKQKGRIVIPTDKGRVVFKDNPVEEDNPDWEVYHYRGYNAQLESHLIEHNHYEWSSDILVDKRGRQTEVYTRPVCSPDFRSFVTISAGIEDAVFPNEIRLYSFENHRWRQVWKLEPAVAPATWEPDEIGWLSNSTLLLKKRMWTGKNPGATFTYAELTIR